MPKVMFHCTQHGIYSQIYGETKTAAVFDIILKKYPDKHVYLYYNLLHLTQKSPYDIHAGLNNGY